AQRRGAEGFAVIRPQGAKSSAAQIQGLVEHCVEHRLKVTGRGVDDLQYLGGRSLAGKRLVEPLTQLRVGTATFSHLVVERRGHVLLRPLPCFDSIILPSVSGSSRDTVYRRRSDDRKGSRAALRTGYQASDFHH